MVSLLQFSSGIMFVSCLFHCYSYWALFGLDSRNEIKIKHRSRSLKKKKKLLFVLKQHCHLLVEKENFTLMFNLQGVMMGSPNQLTMGKNKTNVTSAFSPCCAPELPPRDKAHRSLKSMPQTQIHGRAS